MNTNPELTIVIPAKNEKNYLPRLLRSLTQQDYPLISTTSLFLADAGSTDGTVELALSYDGRLQLSVIPGGLPAVGRNAGARRAESEYVLFIDADMELDDPTLIRRSMEAMRRRRLNCATTSIRCSNGGIKDHLLYSANNFAQRLSSFTKPFSSGMYMLFRKDCFDRLGGFHEGALYAEDYLLSKQISPLRFGIIRGHIQTSNRRFQKMGHLKIVKMFLKTAINSWNENYFLKDHNYWQEVESSAHR